jgi:hypothetical protein
MKPLLDECIPKPLTRVPFPHEAKLVQQTGWADIRNRRLLALAAPSFDAFVTVDQNLEHQQNVGALPMAVTVVPVKSNRFADSRRSCPSYLPHWPACPRGRSSMSVRFRGCVRAVHETPRQEVAPDRPAGGGE